MSHQHEFHTHTDPYEEFSPLRYRPLPSIFMLTHWPIPLWFFFFYLTISVSCIFYWILTIIYLVISFNKWWIFYCFIRVVCMFVCVIFLIYCFLGGFRFRMWCQKVISHRLFDHIVLVFIFLNCITIALERPDIKNDSTVRHTHTQPTFKRFLHTHQNCLF